MAASALCSQDLWDGIRHGATTAQLKTRYGTRLVLNADHAEPGQIDYPRYRIDNVALCGVAYTAHLHFPSDGRDALTSLTLRRSSFDASAVDQAACMFRELTSHYGRPKQDHRADSGGTAIFLKDGIWVVLQTHTPTNAAFVHFESAY